MNNQLRDAIGQPVTIGWAAKVEPSRGSVKARKVYIVGTKGTKTMILGSEWGIHGTTEEDLLAAYLRGEEVPTYTKVATRIVMLNLPN